jgi:hypothetical protein
MFRSFGFGDGNEDKETSCGEVLLDLAIIERYHQTPSSNVTIPCRAIVVLVLHGFGHSIVRCAVVHQCAR